MISMGWIGRPNAARTNPHLHIERCCMMQPIEPFESKEPMEAEPAGAALVYSGMGRSRRSQRRRQAGGGHVQRWHLAGYPGTNVITAVESGECGVCGPTSSALSTDHVSTPIPQHGHHACSLHRPGELRDRVRSTLAVGFANGSTVLATHNDRTRPALGALTDPFRAPDLCPRSSGGGNPTCKTGK
jgi:hypothetical protein